MGDRRIRVGEVYQYRSPQNQILQGFALHPRPHWGNFGYGLGIEFVRNFDMLTIVDVLGEPGTIHRCYKVFLSRNFKTYYATFVRSSTLVRVVKCKEI